MDSEELAHTTAISETSRPASPASVTELQTIPVETPGLTITPTSYDSGLHQETASNTTLDNTDNIERFSPTVDQLDAGDQGQVQCHHIYTQLQ